VKKIRSVHNNINLLESVQNHDSLIPLQIQVEELIATYRLKLEDLVTKYDPHYSEGNLSQIEEKFGARLAELESKIEQTSGDKLHQLEHKNQSSWKSIRQELINVNSQFNQANRTLNGQFNQQIENLRQDLDHKVSAALEDWSRQRAALQEWAVQRDEMRPDLDDYESKNRQELMSVVNPMRASLGDVDQQLRKMRGRVRTNGLLTLLAIAVSGYVLLSQVKSGDSFLIPSQNTPSKNTPDVN
jgi:tRNA/tmRNA/rRNA uracil-C5-methylase (TrmA/RlmC/RlmD family)